MADPTDQLTLLTCSRYSNAQMQRVFAPIRVELGGADLGFTMNAPAGWDVVPVSDAAPGPATPMVELVRVTGEGLGEARLGGTATIIVRCAWLPREMNGADWLEVWLGNAGLRRIDGREAATSYGLMGDVLAVNTAEGRTRLHRLMTVKDADRLFLIDAEIDAGAKLDLAQEVFLIAAISFALVAPTGRAFAEPFHWISVKTAAGEVRILAPESWPDRPGEDAPQDGDSRMLENRLGGQVVGTLIAVTSAGSLSAEALKETTLGKARAQGIVIDGRPELASREPSGRFEVTTWIASARRGKTELTILAAAATAEEEGAQVALVLISPSPQASPEAWAINRRAFDIAMGSLS